MAESRADKSFTISDCPGSARRETLSRARSPRRRDPYPPYGGSAIFLAAIRRKPLIILESEKRTEIF
jgi:hypothetical protein